jgi:YD repeat-containing protein
LAQGAPVEMRDPQGRRVELVRDARRNLRRLVSPNARTIALDYDDGGRVSHAQDDDGHTVDYSYDSEGRLALVSENGRPSLRYRYDPDQPDKMAAVEDSAGGALVRNSYFEDGQVSAQTLADGSRYLYHYEVDAQGQVTQATVTTPDQGVHTFAFRNGALISRK